MDVIRKYVTPLLQQWSFALSRRHAYSKCQHNNPKAKDIGKPTSTKTQPNATKHNQTQQSSHPEHPGMYYMVQRNIHKNSPDKNVGWVNVEPTSGRQHRHWTKVGPTYITVWESCPFCKRFIHHNLNSAQISFFCHLNSKPFGGIVTKFCTCHDNRTVVACANIVAIWSLMDNNWITAMRIFHRIWIARKIVSKLCPRVKLPHPCIVPRKKFSSFQTCIFKPVYVAGVGVLYVTLPLKICTDV